ncbi:hypothetical protein DFR70_1011171 [Nocardia tenerifensis]|uniref:Small secreted domain DUF320 n=1 Tax=Nocardia tenerifensis TaxID=228006 RepID=A0A318KD14_9NOCA|nr:hypothetical protein [Nocardia tenerifensis]PXX71737.1 hypothetical protein DFR70_1011171 [Nocardia tenerifensis]
MNTRKLMAGGLLCAASLLVAAPQAQAGTGSSSLGSLINVGCLLQSLSAQSPTADCKPPQIPVAGVEDTAGLG